MSFDLKSVLALLPELFPGVQAIPLGRIRSNPDNPGPPITMDQIQELAVPILEDGLVTPAKLRPNPFNPLTPGVSLHPDNPRLKADGTPWKVEDFNWMILAGERRLRAFQKLQGEGWAWLGASTFAHQASYRLVQGPHEGKTCIPAYILNPTEEEAVIITHTDNDVRERGWFAAYQSIEALLKANPGQNQRQIAAKLKMDRVKVGRAIGLLPLLNSEARVLIGRIPANSNKGIRGISEYATCQLTALGPGTGLKPGVRKEGDETQRLWPYPPIPAETQGLVLRALRVASNEYMTEAEVGKFVAFIQGGSQPEDYRRKGGKVPQGQQTQVKASHALLAGLTGLTTLATKASAKFGATTNGRGKRASNGMSGGSGMKTLLLSLAKRVLGSLIRRWIVTGVAALVVILFLSPHLYISLYHLAFGYRRTPSSQPSIVSNQGVPGMPVSTANTAQAVPTPNPTPVIAAQQPKMAEKPSSPVKVPPQWKDRVKRGQDLADIFAISFYGLGYFELNDDLNFITTKLLDPDYAPGFIQAYLPLSKLDQIKQLKLYEWMEPENPSRLLALDGKSETFLVKGPAHFKSDAKQKGQLVAQGSIAVEIRVLHTPGEKGYGSVVWVKELKGLPIPDNLATSSNVQKHDSSGDLASQINGGVKDYQNAVNTAGGAKTATDKAKGLFRF